jgi:hypothetical protein
MIVAQEQAFLKAHAQLSQLCGDVERAAGDGRRIDQVERDLFGRLLELGHTLLTAFVASHGDGDAGEELPSGDHAVRRLEEPRTRRYLSIFGELSITGRVYARRKGQKIERAPLEERLGLPEGEFSYVLEDWLQRMCVKESFAGAVTSLKDLLGVAPSARAAEEMSQRWAADAPNYLANQQPPPGAEEGKIVVFVADGKGVPMRRPLEETLHSSAPPSDEHRRGKKQMACVGAVYTIDPFCRTSDEVVDEVRRHERAADRPRPQHKELFAELTTIELHEERRGGGKTVALEDGPVAKPSVLAARSKTFAQIALACHRRDPERKKPLVCVMDGERALWEMAGEWLPWALGILDLFHVLQRLWQAAHCFHRANSPEAEEFVTHRLRMLLEGQVGYVIGGLRRMCDSHGLRGPARTTLNEVITYYENNRQHMKYDEYIAAGYPIGSGVAEGACRHVINDRLEQTGMRWSVPGAQAMLHLRVIHLNERWSDYVEHHIATEQSRLYGQLAA